MIRKKWYRQGDVLLIPVESIPTNAIQQSTKIIAEGEVTGHHHQFQGENVAVFLDPTNAMYVSVLEQSFLVHNEHGVHQIPQGKYQIFIERELDEVGKMQQVRD